MIQRWLQSAAAVLAGGVVLLLAFPASAADADVPLYRRPEVPIEQRVDDLVGRMTVQEKLAQLSGFWPGDSEKLISSGELFTDDYLAKNIADGVGTIGPVFLPIADDVRFRNGVQKFLREKTRLGIPVIFHDEGCHGVMKDQATSFPMPIGFACCWDEALVEQAYDVVGREMRARGGAQALTPILDVARDPRWGRFEETMGEDPYLNGRIGAAVVRGLQGGASGEIDGEHVMSTLKHFCGHGTPEGGLNRSPAECGMRELRELHLAPFEYVINAAQPAAVMPSYNEIDGVPSHANRWLLQDVLRGEFGFRGLIVSDYHGVARLVEVQHVAADPADAAHRALAAGVQMELPNPYGFVRLDKQIAAGTVDVKLVDDAVRAVLTRKFKLGLFESPFADAAKAEQLARRPESRALALRAARESIVLLKNDGGILPLSTNKQHKIAVIGPNANIARLGGYSGAPFQTVSLLDGIRAAVGATADVTYAPGCVIVKNEQGAAFNNWKFVTDVKLATAEENRPLIQEAARVAAAADVVVLVLGDVESTCREAWAPNHLGDRASLDLPGSQMDLARAVLDAGKPVVAYLMNGRPAAIGELKARAAAIVEGWYMGQETGTAAADILFGTVCPSGKLTCSFPQDAGHIPAYYSKKEGAGEFNYLFSDNAPLFAFGEGLSYTTFAYGKPRLKESKIQTDGATQVSVDITNTGPMAGDEIVQLYIHQEVASVTRPVMQLAGFKRIHLDPGQTKPVTFDINAAALALYDIDMRRTTEPGTYKIMVGPSSRKLETVMLELVRGAAPGR